MSMAEDRSVYQSDAVPCRPSSGVHYKLHVDGFRVDHFTEKKTLDASGINKLRERCASHHNISRAGIRIVKEKKNEAPESVPHALRRIVRYRIYVNGSLASVEKYPEMNGQELDEFGRKWAAERMINGSTIEIYPWMEEGNG